MKITRPDYYDTFRCIASRCPDSCCKEWDVQVDDDAAEYYRSLPGALGDRLREVLREADGETVMTIVDGRCPMWRQDGLCRIQAELGEEALCHTCREFPRLRHDYGHFVEQGLELSCPEAARIILSSAAVHRMETETPEAGEAEYDEYDMACLKSSREQALALLEIPGYTVGERLALLLFYGYQAQNALDGAEPEAFSPEQALESAREMAAEAELGSFLRFFSELEVLTPQWEQLLREEHTVSLPAKTLPLARYLIERYWLQAVSDFDLAARVKFIIISCILVGTLGGDYTRTAQLYSKEIENDADNVDAILDGAYEEPAFTDDKLLGMLLS